MSNKKTTLEAWQNEINQPLQIPSPEIRTALEFCRAYLSYYANNNNEQFTQLSTDPPGGVRPPVGRPTPPTTFP